MSERLFLKQGGHSTLAAGACAMELTAWLAGEKHSDHPTCVSPVIGAFMRRLNDGLPDAERQALLPYCIRVIGTNTGREDDITRGFMAADCGVRIAAPAALDALGRKEWADQLRAIPPITDRASARIAADLAQKVCAAAAAGAYADAGAYAYAYADAYAGAYAAAYAAADAYAAAAAYAYAAAYAAADAYAAAAAAADAYAAVRRRVWAATRVETFALIDRMIAVGDRTAVECVPERVHEYATAACVQ